MNILIPMAGNGSRFVGAGFEDPKPFIDVLGEPMINLVVRNIGLKKSSYIFVCKSDHVQRLKDSIYNLNITFKIVTCDETTDGAACTALLAKDVINNDEPLFFANSDQVVDWPSGPVEFFWDCVSGDLDGIIATFVDSDPKWSFAKVGEDGLVEEVAEKKPISNIATVGYYWWRKGSDFVKYAESMIEKNQRVNNEFYVCPVFNEAIKDGKRIGCYFVNRMHGLGTPEDLEKYIEFCSYT